MRLFKQDLSADQISGRLAVLYPEQPEKQASTSTIYDERPKVVEEKSRTGDWEGDTIESAGKSAYIATFVDRKTKFLLAKVMPDKTAAALNRAAVRAFKPIPGGMRNTLALDNGKQFAAHKSLSHALGINIYFAHRKVEGEA